MFGRQENAAVGYNPRYRGNRSYNPLLCIEATVPICGIPNSVPAMLVHGTAASNYWRPASLTYRPTSESSGFGRMPVLVSIQLTQACSVRVTVATQERVPHGTIIQCACIRGSLLLAASYSAANSRTYVRCGVFDAKENLLVGVANKSALSGLCPNAP